MPSTRRSRQIDKAHALNQDNAAQPIEATEGTRLYVPIVLAITTGLRRSERLGLKWEDINGPVLAVRRKVEQTRAEGAQIRASKTSKSVRTVALPAFVVGLLRRHKTEQRKLRLRSTPFSPPSSTGRHDPEAGVAVGPQSDSIGLCARQRRQPQSIAMIGGEGGVRTPDVFIVFS
jgi:integrase